MPSVYNPHLILLDIDGTLIRSNGTIPSANIKTINKLKEMGNIVCLATGRADETAEYIYHTLNLTTPSILNSGAIINNFSDPNFKIKRITITDQVKANILNNEFQKLIKCFYVYLNGIHYLSSHSDCILVNSNIDLGKKYQILPIEDIFKIKNITSIIFELHDNCEEKFLKIIKKIDVVVTKWQIFNTESSGVVYDAQMKNASKGAGGEILRKMFNISPENTISFGDSDNDISSIKWAKNGVAMKNGIDNVKKIANAITKKTNEEGGVSHYLNEYFNLS